MVASTMYKMGGKPNPLKLQQIGHCPILELILDILLTEPKFKKN